MSFFLQQIPASGHGSSPAAECHGTPPARAGRQGGAKRGSGSLRDPAAPSRSPSALQQGCCHGRQPRTSTDIFPERCGVSAPVRDSTRASAPQSRARGRGACGGRGAQTRLHPPPVAPARSADGVDAGPPRCPRVVDAPSAIRSVRFSLCPLVGNVLLTSRPARSSCVPAPVAPATQPLVRDVFPRSSRTELAGASLVHTDTRAAHPDSQQCATT